MTRGRAANKTLFLELYFQANEAFLKGTDCTTWKKQSRHAQRPFKIPIQIANLITWLVSDIKHKIFFSCFLNVIKTFTGVFTNRNLLLATFCSSLLRQEPTEKKKSWAWCNTIDCTLGSAEHLCCWQNSDWHLTERQGWYFQSSSKWKSVHSSIWMFHLGFSVSVLVHKSYWSSMFFLKRNLART